MKRTVYLVTFLVIYSFVVTGLLVALLFISSKNKNNLNNHKNVVDNKKIELIKTVSAAEIYPEFLCPCCGKPLDPNKICCGAMKQRIDFIDNLVSQKLSKSEIMMATVKEFGVNSLINENTKKEIKKNLLASAGKDSPKIIFEKEIVDMGQVSQAQGEAIAYFAFKNEGKNNLVINKISTSCGCTSASIVYKEKEGPTFTMPGHGKENPTDWSVKILHGDKAKLKVYYDPNAHGKQKEKKLDITRTISIFSNDPVEFEKEVRIELEQIP